MRIIDDCRNASLKNHQGMKKQCLLSAKANCSRIDSTYFQVLSSRTALSSKFRLTILVSLSVLANSNFQLEFDLTLNWNWSALIFLLPRVDSDLQLSVSLVIQYFMPRLSTSISHAKRGLFNLNGVYCRGQRESAPSGVCSVICPKRGRPFKRGERAPFRANG